MNKTRTPEIMHMEVVSEGKMETLANVTNVLRMRQATLVEAGRLMQREGEYDIPPMPTLAEARRPWR